MTGQRTAEEDRAADSGEEGDARRLREAGGRGARTGRTSHDRGPRAARRAWRDPGVRADRLADDRTDCVRSVPRWNASCTCREGQVVSAALADGAPSGVLESHPAVGGRAQGFLRSFPCARPAGERCLLVEACPRRRKGRCRPRRRCTRPGGSKRCGAGPYTPSTSTTLPQVPSDMHRLWKHRNVQGGRKCLR